MDYVPQLATSIALCGLVKYMDSNRATEAIEDSVAPSPALHGVTSCKRTRDQIDEADETRETAADSTSNYPLKMPKFKKAKYSKSDSFEPLPSTNDIAITCPGTNAQSEADISSALATSHNTSKGLSKTRSGLSATCTADGSYETLEERLSQLQAELAALRDERDRENKMHAQEKLNLKQTILLDSMCRLGKFENDIAKLRKEKHYLIVELSEQKNVAETQTQDLQKHKAALVKARNNSHYYKKEADHLEALNKIMEEDLNELRQIEIEDAAARRLKETHLPPAYGALDDEDQFPTPQLHEDGGAFDIAVVKRTVRESFMRRLQMADDLRYILRDRGRDLVADSIVYIETTLALAEACAALRAALEYAEQIYTTVVEVRSKTVPLTGGDKEKVQHLRSRQLARREFVADRVAKVILDLSWRAIAATELRPAAFVISQEQKSRVNLAYREVDTTLVHALRLALSTTRGQDAALWEYKYYHSQISKIHASLEDLRLGLCDSAFAESITWLEEQVEVWRMQAADRRPTAQSITQSTAQPTVQHAVQPAAQPTAEAAAHPTAQFTVQAVAQTAQPAAESKAQSTELSTAQQLEVQQ